MNQSISQQIQIFKSIFRGREDAFAIRWENNNKSGYVVAYDADPYMLQLHKMKGGTLKNYQDKSCKKLSDFELEKHLKGYQHIGIYPLLSDNTSWFIVADFDKNDWIEAARKYYNYCNTKEIPAYIERSRSGNGAHVWVFFEEPFPAFQSRKIFISFLEQSGAFSVFDKNLSFDRLFPNQDKHVGKGLGNLIALPLQKKCLDNGNCCFIDPESLKAYPDQWDFLSNIRKIPKSTLENLFKDLSKPVPVSNVRNITDKLTIILSNNIRINQNAITLPLRNFLKEELNFLNSEYIIKKKVGRNTFGTEHFFNFIVENDDEIFLPRGFIGKLIRFCRENNIVHEFMDKRNKLEPIQFSFNAHLYDYQKSAFELIAKKDLGVIVAPPASGKTIIGLKIISEKQQPTLIIVHRKQLLEQWSERIETFLGIPKIEIGKIGEGKTKIGKKITVATIQTLSKLLASNDKGKYSSLFGTIIIDEAHHIPSETFRNTISQLDSWYLYGLTATPFRKYNDGKLIFIHLGEIIAELKSSEIASNQHPKIIIRNTDLDVPFNSKTDTFETLSKILIHDTSRNRLILEDIKAELNNNKKVVIITERKEHIDSLYQYLKQSYEAITLSGDDSEANRENKWKILKNSNYQVLITTGQFFGEGTDLQNANSLFLVYPFSFKGKLIQYIGRVQRSEISPVIYDYHDNRIDYLHKLFLKRNTYYRKIERQTTLFDEPVIDDRTQPSATISIERNVKIPVETLQFHFGSITFKAFIVELNSEVEFDIENLDIRPEFEVLKPYFTKVLKSAFVRVNIFMEIENDKILSQLATSDDIEKINREMIESVKFRFISKNIFVKTSLSEKSLLTIDDIQQSTLTNSSLYNDGNALLNDILNMKQYKHSRQLRFLSEKHDSSILKIRFILSPFSFVFLLSGKEQFHIVIETLDTEEATYLWHINKNKNLLKIELNEIDQHISTIRNKGRQAFLANIPENFSRIVHDYSDEIKGFIIWKDLLNERIV